MNNNQLSLKIEIDYKVFDNLHFILSIHNFDQRLYMVYMAASQNPKPGSTGKIINRLY